MAFESISKNLALAVAALAVAATAVAEPQIRRTVLDEPPPDFDYWDLTETQRASYAVFATSPSDPEALSGASGSLPVSIRFDILSDAPPPPRKENPNPEDDESLAKHGVEDDDGNIVGVLECNYSAGIPHIN